jgi:hypothetical protein
MCQDRRLPVVATAEVLLEIHRDDVGQRRGLGREAQPRSGEPLYRSTCIILERHESRIARSPTMHYRYLSVAGVAGMRAGHPREARRFFVRAVRLRPWSLRAWARAAAASIGPVARRAWRVAAVTPPAASTAPTARDH